MGYARDSYMDFDQMKEQNRKEGMIHFKTNSFDQWYGISCTKLRVDDELSVDQGADKRSISTAFKKMNRGKKTNRVMVKQFIDQIA
jgi:negative regulator of genetic competence, sporulation and motility